MGLDLCKDLILEMESQVFNQLRVISNQLRLESTH